ncbi:MAG: ROK family protein [Bacteroidota bacterium]
MKDKITIGIDIGGTKTKIGYLDDKQTIQVVGQISTSQDPNQAVKNIVSLIREANLLGSIEKIGIACPGPLNQKSGLVLSPPNLQKWKRFPIVDLLKKEFNVPVALDNDANAGALGEAVYGSASNANTVLYVTISTGIGAGIVINKKIHAGFKGLAGEIWCFPPQLFGAKTDKWNITDLSSGNGLVQVAEEKIKNGKIKLDANKLTTHMIVDAFYRNENWAVVLIEQARRILNAILVFSSCLLAPDVIVLGGGLTNDNEIFVNPLKTMFNSTMPLEDLKKTPILSSELKNDNVLYGTMAMIYKK